MKRAVYSIVIIFLLMLSATSCTAQKATSNVTEVISVKIDGSTASSTTSEKKPEIDVQSPMTLSNTEEILTDANGFG